MVNWRERAACIYGDPELWFKDTLKKQDKIDREKAKEICDTCSVKTQCLKFAINNHIEYGIFGGLDANERKKDCARSTQSQFRNLQTTNGMKG